MCLDSSTWGETYDLIFQASTLAMADIVKSKPKTKKKKQKKPNIEGQDFNDELGVNLAIARMDPEALSKYMTGRVQRFAPKLSSIELDELNLTG